jgi:hypothetical protein
MAAVEGGRDDVGDVAFGVVVVVVSSTASS